MPGSNPMSRRATTPDWLIVKDNKVKAIGEWKQYPTDVLYVAWEGDHSAGRVWTPIAEALAMTRRRAS